MSPATKLPSKLAKLRNVFELVGYGFDNGALAQEQLVAHVLSITD